MSVFRDSTIQTEEVQFGILELSVLSDGPSKNTYMHIYIYIFTVLFNNIKGLFFLI